VELGVLETLDEIRLFMRLQEILFEAEGFREQIGVEERSGACHGQVARGDCSAAVRLRPSLAGAELRRPRRELLVAVEDGRGAGEVRRFEADGRFGLVEPL
jgi:hypothetical protein